MDSVRRAQRVNRICFLYYIIIILVMYFIRCIIFYEIDLYFNIFRVIFNPLTLLAWQIESTSSDNMLTYLGGIGSVRQAQRVNFIYFWFYFFFRWIFIFIHFMNINLSLNKIFYFFNIFFNLIKLYNYFLNYEFFFFLSWIFYKCFLNCLIIDINII